MPQPLAYLITFTCYGVEKYAVIGESKQKPYLLDAPARKTVLHSIEEACGRRDWVLIAAHVRTNHVHAIVKASQPPECVMHQLKSHATRSLNRLERTVLPRRWTRDGITHYLWKDEGIANAVDYVLLRQGRPMAVFPVRRALSVRRGA